MTYKTLVKNINRMEKEMATHSIILAWRIPWAEEPEGYSPRGLKESDTSEPLSLPLHGMIFKSKFTVIIQFSLNIKKKKY